MKKTGGLLVFSLFCHHRPPHTTTKNVRLPRHCWPHRVLRLRLVFEMMHAIRSSDAQRCRADWPPIGYAETPCRLSIPRATCILVFKGAATAMAPKLALFLRRARKVAENEPERQEGDSGEMVGLVGIDEWNSCRRC